MSVSEDDDLPQLSSETFAILHQFYKEQEEREKRLELVASQAINGDIAIHEDWVNTIVCISTNGINNFF